MKINLELIKKFEPYYSLILEFEKEYPNYNGELEEFLKLEKIGFQTKTWVAVRLMTRTQLVKFAISCVEPILPIFEEKYPEDKSPRACLEYLKTYGSFENLTEDQINEIRKHRYVVLISTFDSISALLSALNIPVYVAYSGDPNGADNAAKAIYFYLRDDADTQKTHEEKCLGFVLDVLKENEMGLFKENRNQYENE